MTRLVASRHALRGTAGPLAPLLFLATLAVGAAAMASVPGAGAHSMGGAGFWLGLLHGLSAPVTLIASLFADVGVYQFAHTSPWYDAGFLGGLSTIVGLVGMMDLATMSLLSAFTLVLVRGAVGLGTSVIRLLA